MSWLQVPEVLWDAPQVWGGATDAAAGAKTGAVARMHSALIAVVAHLLSRLGGQALAEAQVCFVATALWSPAVRQVLLVLIMAWILSCQSGILDSRQSTGAVSSSE